MRILPAKSSPRWLWVFLVYLIVAFTLIAIPQVLLYNAALSPRSLAGMALLAGIISALACLGGYLGFMLYFLLFTAAVLGGSLYVLASVLTNGSTGWGGLTSLSGFSVLAVLGLGIALLLQLVAIWAKAIRRRYRK